MRSLYLSSLTPDQVLKLRKDLFDSQGGKCFICDDVMDLALHGNSLQIDHVQPLGTGGKDAPQNFALTHGSCNDSKQASDLRVARLLARFDKIRANAEKAGDDYATLKHVLAEFGGSKYSFKFTFQGDRVRYSFPDVGDNGVYNSQVFDDHLSHQKSFFAEIPLEYVFHDTKINPRGIGNNLRKLVEEFFKGRPQLHVTLARLNGVDSEGELSVFDGQHKAAAQLLLGAKKLPMRIFLNPDLDLLLTTNTNAGDSLRQVASLAFPANSPLWLALPPLIRHTLSRNPVETYHTSLD